jgi:hypothetical protein
MKKILSILILTIGLATGAKADTIDYWHVYYNNIKLKEFNQYAKGEIILKIKDIKRQDSLTVKYFRDTPCSDCETEVTIENSQKFVLAKGTGTGTFNPIKISVFDLLIKAAGNQLFVYYQENTTQGELIKTLLFKIKLE